MKKLLLVIPFLLVACDASHDVEWYKNMRKSARQQFRNARKTRMNFRNLIAKTRAKPIVSCLCSAKKTAKSIHRKFRSKEAIWHSP